MPAHLAVEGRTDFGVAEVQLGEIDLRLRPLDVSLRRLLLENPVVDVYLRGRVSAQEGSVALDFEARMVARHGRRLELRLRLLHLRLILFLLNGEEEIILLDDRAILEMDLLEIAGHAGDELDLTDGLRIAGQRQRLADRLHLRQDDGDREGGGGLGRRRSADGLSRR
jgi:hypothetical protein